MSGPPLASLRRASPPSTRCRRGGRRRSRVVHGDEERRVRRRRGELCLQPVDLILVETAALRHVRIQADQVEKGRIQCPVTGCA
jgi:hypothetical protein